MVFYKFYFVIKIKHKINTIRITQQYGFSFKKYNPGPNMYGVCYK